MNRPEPIRGSFQENTMSGSGGTSGNRPQIGSSFSPNPPSTPSRDNQTFNNVRPESLVQNQIGNVLNADNDYMRQAASVGRQAANSRGIQDSTMGIEAVRSAQVQAALPIAQQDASLYGQSDLQQNAFMQNQQLQTDQFGYNTQLANQQFGHNTQLADQAFGHNEQLANINSNNSLALNNMGHMQNMQQRLQESIAQVNSDVSLSPEQRRDMINNMIADFNNQMQFSQQYQQGFSRGADQLASTFNFQGQSMSPIQMNTVPVPVSTGPTVAPPPPTGYSPGLTPTQVGNEETPQNDASL